METGADRNADPKVSGPALATLQKLILLLYGNPPLSLGNLSEATHRGQKRTLDPVELKLQAVSFLMFMLNSSPLKE